MRQSKLFPKTKRQAPAGAESINHQLLVRAGFMDQLMAGSWTLLPLGWRVVDKISNIIREELAKIDAQEILMPLLHPKSIWSETGRWDSADEVMYKLAKNDKDYVLSFTHEEIFLDIIRKLAESYKDLPVALYHFSTKFRNELRAKSGILRGREFLMKDLYSVHSNQRDLDEYYFEVLKVYQKIFDRIGFKYKVTEAGGGVFTDNITHEVQVISESGEDTIYFCDKCDFGINQELVEDGTYSIKEGSICPKCKKGELNTASSIEVGNVFRFGQSYSEKMGATFIDQMGEKKYFWLGSYGIGTTRVMGTWVEVSHDDKGIVWSKELAPFAVHLIELPGGNGKEAYEKLTKAGVEVLWDDREVGAGEKFADADLIGIPVRLTTSSKTAKKVEFKERSSDKLELLDVEGALGRLK